DSGVVFGSVCAVACATIESIGPHAGRDGAHLTDRTNTAVIETAAATPISHDPPSVGIRIATLVTIFLPLIGLAAGIVLIWPIGFGWVSLALLLVMYVLTGFGVTVGYHRLFTHRSFETGPFMTAVLAVL